MKTLLLSGVIITSCLLAIQSSEARLDIGTNGCTSMTTPYTTVSITTSPTDFPVLNSHGWYDIYTTTDTYSNCIPSGLPILINSTTVATMGSP